MDSWRAYEPNQRLSVATYLRATTSNAACPNNKTSNFIFTGIGTIHSSKLAKRARRRLENTARELRFPINKEGKK